MIAHPCAILIEPTDLQASLQASDPRFDMENRRLLRTSASLPCLEFLLLLHDK
jgi:hypothetical protein